MTEEMKDIDISAMETKQLEQDAQITQEDISAQFGRMIFTNMQLSKQIEALQKQNARLMGKKEKE